MTEIDQAAVLRAHQCLMRGKAGLWMSAALVACGIAGSIWLSLSAAVFAAVAGIAYFVSLGLIALAGNAIGRFGLKYLLAAVGGAALLAAVMTPLAALLAPVGVFFWAKQEVGVAFRSLMAREAQVAQTASSPTIPATQ